MPDKPLIAITMGDPCGIGPEIIAKALQQEEPRQLCEPVVIGNAAVLQRAFELVNAPLRSQPVSDPQAKAAPGAIAVYDPAPDPSLSTLKLGTIHPAAGKASAAWIVAAGKLAMDRKIAAIATAPINKAAVHAGGSPDMDHQSMFKRLTGSPRVLTMLMTTNLKVVHLTTHYSLRKACEQVTKENVLEVVRLTHNFFRTYGFRSPRIGVAALNPHGGEEGLLGDEEIVAIKPAVEAAQSDCINVAGPIPADSLYPQAIDGRYDVVIAMYHDQGHIAVKVHGWQESITMNLGLPFLRTSVDHGTAFDIAGKGIADPTGMITAIRAAAQVAGQRSLATV